jgi:acyl-CoA reductase-like NAD-dependent aldehyde dehydrogenase
MTTSTNTAGPSHAAGASPLSDTDAHATSASPTNAARGPILENGEIGGVCPVDLHSLPVVHATPLADVRAIVERARRAQPAWEALGFEGRAALIKKAAKLLLERRAEAGRLIREESGKLAANAQMHEAIGPLEYAGGWIKVARAGLRRRKLPINRLAMPGKRAFTDMIARGVVGVIAPWNYPLGVFFKPVLPALLSGNAVVLKPSEYSPRTAQFFADVMSEVLPKDLVVVVQGGRDVGAALIESGIDALSFTGSPVGGRAVLAACAQRMIPCSVELGGKDPAIVLADCDVERTALGVLNWGMHNTGQDCGSVERVYVVESVADRFVDALALAASRVKVAARAEDEASAGMAPLANPMQLGIVEQHVADAIAKGAVLRAGGKRTGFGLSYEATVLDRCNNTMLVVADETFGPVLPVIRVKDVDEAIRLANDSRYGLNASVWTKDVERGEQIAKQLQCGTVFINNHAITGAMPFAPWTGVKDTGYGVANSEHALHTFARPKTTFVDTNKSPDPWWLPADALLQDMAERLANAQLGKVKGALKLPSIMKQRQRRLLELVRK